jgi:predicted SpoU family rRNA methylase
VETGVLRVTHAGVREDFVDTLSALTARELTMENSRLGLA